MCERTQHTLSYVTLFIQYANFKITLSPSAIAEVEFGKTPKRLGFKQTGRL